VNRGTKKAVTKQRAATMDAFFSVRQVNVHSKKKLGLTDLKFMMVLISLCVKGEENCSFSS